MTAEPQMAPTSPFLRSTSSHAFDIYTDAAVHLLADRGVDQLSVRAIARWMGVTPAAVLQQHSRTEVVEIVVARFAQRWLEWSRAPRASDLPARLPVTGDECQGVRVWHALVELARGARAAGDPEPLAQVERARREERERIDLTLAHLVGRRAEPHELEAVLALVSGLRAELAAPGTTLVVGVAEDIMSRYVRNLRQRRGSDRSRPA